MKGRRRIPRKIISHLPIYCSRLSAESLFPSLSELASPQDDNTTRLISFSIHWVMGIQQQYLTLFRATTIKGSQQQQQQITSSDFNNKECRNHDTRICSFHTVHACQGTAEDVKWRRHTNQQPPTNRRAEEDDAAAPAIGDSRHILSHLTIRHRV